MASSPGDPSDADLVRRYVAGDQAAFSALVSRHERRVYNLAYRMLGREEDARDATQDAFLTALRKLSSFRGEAAFTTWMHRVTVNACYDILRKRKREPVLDEPSEDDRPARPAGPPSPDHADSASTAVDVQRALVQVPHEFRAVLVLHDVQDLGYEEIAEILGVPVGTVKSRLHRGRVALGRLLPGERSGSPEPSEGKMSP
ncbi:MAG: sigma-70 family RNA polymerase sigma factor [Actinomycetota bacterium]|nr:sigma-70 family RNA polymerase sigma factor [Actinomycetota bacterium]